MFSRDIPDMITVVVFERKFAASQFCEDRTVLVRYNDVINNKDSSDEREALLR